MDYAVILAGGSGTRFWPRSRSIVPKQVLDIVGEKSLIQQTVERLVGVAGPENVVIVSNAQQITLMQKLLPDLPDDNFLVEPMGRDTAAAIGYACAVIEKRDPGAAVAIMPADHIIEPADKFIATVKEAFDAARESHSLLTIGIKPNHPATGYG